MTLIKTRSTHELILIIQQFQFRLNIKIQFIHSLRNGTIDLLMADSPILDYYRGSDHGCQLRRIGENYIEDTYAIGMSKGFPLKESISALIAKYSSNGYLDILVEKWYGGLPCYRDEDHIEIVQPRPLGVAAVAGVYLMLGLGMILGILILIFEHLFFKYYLPILRTQPKGSVWRSRNVMFFSQVRIVLTLAE
jgi:glutamate receptor ionotropic, NMDA 3A